ncbi:MAG: glycine betaine/L-proline ABC transporter permease ProW [Thermodesulfobacteriota bacterium]
MSQSDAPTTPADPWASPAPAADPWGSSQGAQGADGSSAWLSPAASGGPEQESFDWLHPFQEAMIPFDAWVESTIGWLVENFRPAFQAVRLPIDTVLSLLETLLLATPAPLMIVFFLLLAWQLAGPRLGIFSGASLLAIGLLGAWQQAMVTLALVLTAVFFCLLIGLPSGILLARSPRSASLVRPLLDAMQTTPAFVYLVPIVMLFGIGNVPGVVVTIIFALPPVIRLTTLGIEQVDQELIEAATAFGASPGQLLFKVQLPLALPTIMAGVNQTLMLALSMVVIASMIAVGGLGQMVLRGIGRLDMGLAAVGGVAIVLLAILLDRLTQAVGQRDRDTAVRHWYQSGPLGLLLKLGRNKT